MEWGGVRRMWFITLGELISAGKPNFCLLSAGQMIVSSRHQLAPMCPALVGCARAGWSRGWALPSFPRCAASSCCSGQQQSQCRDAGIQGCGFCLFCMGTDACVFWSCQSCILHSGKIQIGWYQRELHAASLVWSRASPCALEGCVL